MKHPKCPNAFTMNVIFVSNECDKNTTQINKCIHSLEIGEAKINNYTYYTAYEFYEVL